MSRWPARDPETFVAELRVVAHADGVDTDAWIRARSRADDGRDPAGGRLKAPRGSGADAVGGQEAPSDD